MSLPVNVSIVPCPDYSPERLDAAVAAAIAPLGGLDWVKAGMTVAIKTNLVSRMSPDSAAVTHPEAVAALVVLGYSQAEALQAMDGLELAALSAEEIIRQCLKKLVKLG